MSASLVDAFTTSLSCFEVLFEGSLAIETLRAARGLGGIVVVREVSDSAELPFALRIWLCRKVDAQLSAYREYPEARRLKR